MNEMGGGVNAIGTCNLWGNKNIKLLNLSIAS